MIDSKQYFSPWQFGMPALDKVKGEFRICPTYRLITEKYTDIRRRMAEKEAAQASARRAAAARRKAARTQNAKADAAAYNSKK